jgi:hypothetical protein
VASMVAIRRGGRDLRLTLLVLCAVAVVFAVVVSGAAAAQYTVVDLGPQGVEAGPTFEGAVIGISPSGLQVATNCGAWELGTYVHAHPAQSADADDCALGAVNSSDEVVGEWGVPESGSSAQAFSESPVGAADDDFLTAPLANEWNFPDPADSAESIDDAGEIGGGVKAQPAPPAGITNDAYIFDPSAGSGKQVQLFDNDYAVFGLWPDWAEIETSNAVPDTPDPDIDDYITLYDRLTGTGVQTNLATPSPINPGLSGVAPGSSLASDGTLVGPVISDCSVDGCTLAPTMRLADGTETTLSTTGYNFGEVDGVNSSHYSVGEVQLDYPPVAALWNPEGQLEILNNLIPAGSGWDLQNAVAIANDGAIAGTGTLDVDGTPTPENFLLTNNSLLPTATTGACVPATVAPGKTTSCTFTVADTTPGATQKPTGTVTVASDQPGAISPTSQCTLAPASAVGKATCAVSYTPTLNGTPTLTGSYSGDGEHGSSHGTATVTVGSGGSGPGGPKAKVTKPKTSGTSAGASVSCTGSPGSSCTVTLTLSVVQTLVGNKVVAVSASKRKHKRTVVLGKTTVKLAAGKTKTVSVSLNATGKRLLKSRHTLSVELTASQMTGAKSTFTVKFTAKKGMRK